MYLDFVTARDLNKIKTQRSGFVGVNVFYMEHALAYPQPQFSDI